MQQDQYPYEMPDNFNSILIGAAVIVAIGLVPYLSLINAFCCMGLLIAGAASVYHYTTKFRLTLSSGEGFRLGLYAGVLGGLATLVISYTLQLLLEYKTGSELFDMMKELQLSMVQNDPDTAREIDAAFREAEESELTLTQMIFGTAVTLMIDPLFAGIGGAIGAALFKRGN